MPSSLISPKVACWAFDSDQEQRGLCIRQPTAKGNLLVFPSYYRRERADIVKYPAVLVNYRFTGFLDEIYAALIVRLHRTEPFQQDQIWRYAADFKANTGKQLGVKMAHVHRAWANWRRISIRRWRWRRRSQIRSRAPAAARAGRGAAAA